MKIEQILELWKQDCEIDPIDLGDEALNIPKLHHKYYSMLVEQRLRLIALESEHKRLKLDLQEFYVQGPHEHTPKDWKLPAAGRVMRSEVSQYVESDPTMMKMSLKIGYQQEKVALIYSILKNIEGRSFVIKDAIAWAKFQAGG